MRAGRLGREARVAAADDRPPRAPRRRSAPPRRSRPAGGSRGAARPWARARAPARRARARPRPPARRGARRSPERSAFRCRRQPGEDTRSSAACWSGALTNRSSTTRAARRRAPAGPRAATAATRSPGEARLAERADVDDVAVGVVGRERRRRRAVDREVARPVVLDEERARGRGDREHLGAARRREVRAVGVGVQRLQVDDARAGPLERLGQQLRADPVGVARHGQRRQPCRADAGQRPAVGRRLDEHGPPRPARASSR